MTQEKKDEVISKITLSPDCTNKLNDSQVLVMKRVVHEVNNNNRLMGRVLRSTCFELFTLKQLIPRGNWTNFINSDSIPLKPRTIQDLVKTWSWLKDSDITDNHLQEVGVRTMSRLGGVSNEVRERSIKKLKKEGVLTIQDIKKLENSDLSKESLNLIKKKNTQWKSDTTRLKLLDEQNTKLKKRNGELMDILDMNQSGEKITSKHFHELRMENEGLQKEVSDLEQQLDEVLDELEGMTETETPSDNKFRTWVKTTVMKNKKSRTLSKV